MNQPIISIDLDSQVIAIMRVAKINSPIGHCTAKGIADTLGQPTSKVIGSLMNHYDIGAISRYTRVTPNEYKVTDLGERTHGCCCCCNQRLFESSRLFCEACGPHFDERV